MAMQPPPLLPAGSQHGVLCVVGHPYPAQPLAPTAYPYAASAPPAHLGGYSYPVAMPAPDGMATTRGPSVAVPVPAVS